MFHSYAFDFSVWEMWGALIYGGKVVIVPYLMSRDPEAFYNLVCKKSVTVLNQTPSAFRQFVPVDLEQRQKLNLRYVIFGGEALDKTSMRPWFERHGDGSPQLVNMYGITETTVHVTYYPLTSADLDTATSCIGVPIPSLYVYILDEHRQPVPTGLWGEMYVGGGGVTRGYLDRPELSAQRFIADPFSDRLLEAAPVDHRPSTYLYKTGDLGRYNWDGHLEYLGRIDNQVKVRGFRIELGEIESVLAQHPAVQEAVVVVRDDNLAYKHLVAYIVPDKNSAVVVKQSLHLSTEGQPQSTYDLPNKTTIFHLNKNETDLLVHELQSYLKQKLPQFMIPSFFVLLKALPLTPNGKLDRDVLPPPDPKSRYEITYIEPKTDTEKKIAEVWQKLLSVEKVGLDDNFFNLGGHSLLATQMISRLRAAFEIDLPLRSVFDNPTVAALSTFVTERQLAEAQADALEKILAEVEQLSL